MELCLLVERLQLSLGILNRRCVWQACGRAVIRSVGGTLPCQGMNYNPFTEDWFAGPAIGTTKLSIDVMNTIVTTPRIPFP